MMWEKTYSTVDKLEYFSCDSCVVTYMAYFLRHETLQWCQLIPMEDFSVGIFPHTTNHHDDHDKKLSGDKMLFCDKK